MCVHMEFLLYIFLQNDVPHANNTILNEKIFKKILKERL